MYRFNQSGQYVGFPAVSATTGAAMTGTTGFVAYRVIDGGSQVTATGTVTDKGNGQYSFALSQADTNGNDISILFTMTGMVPVEKTFLTTACNPTLSSFGLSLAKTTNITGLNDVTAAAVATAVLTDTTVGDFTTANSPGYLLLQNLDAKVSTRATAAAVWDVALSGHTTAGTSGAALGSAGTAADPWATALPGSYATGTAGKLLSSVPGLVWDVPMSSHTTAGTFGGYDSANDSFDSGTAQGGSSTTIILRAGAPSTIGANCQVSIYGGTGQGQAASVTSYNSGTQTATITPNWLVTPDNTSQYSVYRLSAAVGGGATAAAIATAVWTDTTDLATAGSPGYLLAQNLDAKVSTRSTYAGGAVASVSAPVVVGTNNDKTGYAITLTQTGYTPRDLAFVADSALTTGDLLVAGAFGGSIGKKSVSGTAFITKTSSTGTVIATRTLDSATTPSTVS